MEEIKKFSIIYQNSKIESSLGNWFQITSNPTITPEQRVKIREKLKGILKNQIQENIIIKSFDEKSKELECIGLISKEVMKINLLEKQKREQKKYQLEDKKEKVKNVESNPLKVKIVRQDIESFLRSWLNLKEDQKVADEFAKILTLLEYENDQYYIYFYKKEEKSVLLGKKSTPVMKKIWLKEETNEKPKQFILEDNQLQETFTYGRNDYNHTIRVYLASRTLKSMTNNNWVIHNYDPFEYKITLQTPTSKVIARIKYPKYLSDQNENMYVNTKQIEKILLQQFDPMSITSIYQAIYQNALRKNISDYPNIMIQVVQHENQKTTDYIEIENGHQKTFIETKKNKTLRMNADDSWYFETSKLKMEGKVSNETIQQYIRKLNLDGNNN